MKLYPLFLLMVAVTVFSPGPGVVMTLTNSLRHGLRGAFGGILGVSFGALVVAAISATSLGVILATSAVAFTTLKLMGAAYLVYLRHQALAGASHFERHSGRPLLHASN
jgi:threonine/homoserine/homoserine lactone efflux protein